jgi:hypothetical protein
MVYLIDYRVGGMGNTLCAHILYSCGKCDLNLDNFFSSTGDAHAIRKMYKFGVLRPLHIIEQPELVPTDGTCILEIKTSPWFKLLEIKMGYTKFRLTTPTIDNVSSFFQLGNQSIDEKKLWTDFYENIKDPSWPECNSYDKVINLPLHIRNEIYDKYQPAVVDITDDNLLSLLTEAYYDVINSMDHTPEFGGELYFLDDYFNNNLSIVKKQIQDTLGWQWDDQKSDLFYNHAMKVNQEYIDWLEYIKLLYKETVNNAVVRVDLETWEKSLFLAKICLHYKVHPGSIPWTRIKDLTTNKELIEIFKE